MSQKPPDDEDPIFESIFEQVKSAFTEQEGDPFDANQDDVLNGIRDSLRNLLDVNRPSLEPRVTVVEGGRSKNTPPTNKERPNLFVAESVEDVAPQIAVRLIKSDDVFEIPIASKSMTNSGKIKLCEFEDKQVIYQGRMAKHYRLHIHQGQMALHVDKALIAIVKEGQSIDVEAERIDVLATSPELSLGEFMLLDES